jgi:DNA helicase IV
MPSPSGTDAKPADPSRPANPAEPAEPADPANPAESAKPTEPADPVLAAEREHLRESREYLRLMRENVLALPALGGDRVSIEYLKADLYHRAEALRDIPDAPLFFGRLDYAPGSVWSEEGEAGAGGARFHIGRRHVHDPAGHPIVIDWRAPVSRAFYRASPSDPMDLVRRRRFGFSGGSLTAYEDEDFGGAAPGAGQPSRIMLEEIERPRSGPMRDIVATIQPDQDDIVRADADATVCVQGAPGTGKTAVGLHRVAYLLYAYANRMKRGGVLVIGPNRAFLSYIGNVLPALGEVGVSQVTIADLVATVEVRATDTERAARIKGDARMAEVLRRALWAGLSEPAGGLMLTRGSRRWRVPADEIAGLARELRDRGVRYGPGRDMLGHRIAHVVLTRMEAAGETCDDRTHESVRRTRDVRAVVDEVWPAADPVRLVLRLLSRPDLLARAADGLLDPTEQAEISWPAAPRGPRSARWSAADAVLVDEARDLIERIPSLSHVVVDEAQDLSAMECRAVGRRCATGSATVLGDLAQATTPAAVADWADLLGHLGKPDAGLRLLETGYRVPRQILDYASLLLPQIAPGVPAARSFRQDPGALAVKGTTPAAFTAALAGACADALDRPGSAAVIAADGQVTALARALGRAGMAHQVLGSEGPDERLTLVPVSLAKGLEFDHVIVAEPAAIAGGHSHGLHQLYVALTRAVSRLTVLHSRPLPAPLGGTGGTAVLAATA